MEMHLTPQEEIHSRITQLQQTLVEKNIDAALIIHHTNFYYYTGTSQSGHLFVPQSGEPVLMIKKDIDRAKHESPIEQVVEVKSPKLIMEAVRSAGHTDIKTIGLELDVVPFNTYSFYKKVLDCGLVDISGPVKLQRMIKSEYEIDQLQQASVIIDSIFKRVPEVLQEGTREIDLASWFEGEMRKNGYGGCCKMRAFNQDFFFGNVVSGSSGAVASYFDGPVCGQGLSPANNPHGAGWKKIEKNEIVYIDYTCLHNGYTTDVARMFAIGGVSETMLNAHQAALDIQQKLVEAMQPGAICGELYEMAVSLAREKGYAESFMGRGRAQVKFIGHGVGLELDELPVFAKGVDMPLAAGMTFAIEPKFVFPEGAVGIENTFALTDEGVVKLSNAPEEIVIV